MEEVQLLIQEMWKQQAVSERKGRLTQSSEESWMVLRQRDHKILKQRDGLKKKDYMIEKQSGILKDKDKTINNNELEK